MKIPANQRFSGPLTAPFCYGLRLVRPLNPTVAAARARLSPPASLRHQFDTVLGRRRNGAGPRERGSGARAIGAAALLELYAAEIGSRGRAGRRGSASTQRSAALARDEQSARRRTEIVRRLPDERRSARVAALLRALYIQGEPGSDRGHPRRRPRSTRRSPGSTGSRAHTAQNERLGVEARAAGPRSSRGSSADLAARARERSARAAERSAARRRAPRGGRRGAARDRSPRFAGSESLTAQRLAALQAQAQRGAAALGRDHARRQPRRADRRSAAATAGRDGTAHGGRAAAAATGHANARRRRGRLPPARARRRAASRSESA